MRISACLCFLLLSLGALAKTSENNKRMQELQTAFTQILPDLFSDSEFNSLAGKKRIEKNLDIIIKLTHQTQVASDSGQGDPTLSIIAHLLQEESTRALTNLKQGRSAYARSVLKNIPGYCIACHTRTHQGPDLSTLSKRPSPSKMNRLELAEFMVATRQFDQAMLELEQILSDSSATESKPLEWEKAYRLALEVAVRVKNDPQRALGLIERALHSIQIPQFIKVDSQEWKKAASQWKDESNKKFGTAEGYLAESKRLISDARSVQKYPMDRSGDIQYLRATSTLHQVLESKPNQDVQTEALFLIGVSYEALRDLSVWSLHELYYEMCIRTKPGSDMAKACYERYEKSTYNGFMGSGGLSLPKDVNLHLIELKTLSEKTQKN